MTETQGTQETHGTRGRRLHQAAAGHHGPRRRRGLTALGAAVAIAATALYGGATAPDAAATTDTAATVQLRFVTANTDFGRGGDAADWRNVIAPNSDIVFLQEVKNVNLASFVDTGTWIIRQNKSSADRQGSALLLRRSVVADTSAWGLVKGVDASSCPDGGIMTRWIAKMQVKLKNGRWIRVASLHMPPPRCQTGPGSPYDRMGKNVVSWVKVSNKLTVLGADWNKTVDADPNGIGKASGLEPNGPNDGKRIDGFMYSPALANCCLTRLGAINSDHRPVRIKLTVPAP